MVHEKFNRYKSPLQVAAFSAIALVVASLILTAIHPASGEIMRDFLIQVGLFINLALAALSLLVFLAFTAWGFGRGITIRLTPAGQAPAIPAFSETVGNDRLVILWPGGDEAEYLAKFEAAKEMKSDWVWLVFISFRSAHITIFSSVVTTYQRDEAIFARPEWPDYSGRIAEPGTVFTTETPEDFAEFVRKFVPIFREWSPRVKAEQNAGGVGIPMLEILRHSANVFLLLLFSVSVFGQSKTRQVDEALGTRIREIPASGADVSFIFDNRTFNRVGDGKSDYVELLKKVPGVGSFNDEGGILVAITKDGEPVAKAAHVERVNSVPNNGKPYYQGSTTGDPIRPRGVSAIDPETVGDSGGGFFTNDSLTNAQNAEEVKRQISLYGSKAWAAARPWVGVIMFVFWALFPIVLGAMCLSWMAAKGAAIEGMYNTHKGARRVFFWLMYGCMTLFFINCMITLTYMQVGPMGMTFWAAAIIALLYGTLVWLVPDFKPAKGNQPASIFTEQPNTKRIG